MGLMRDTASACGQFHRGRGCLALRTALVQRLRRLRRWVWGPAPVASFDPNPWGLHDIAGNLSEWWADCWLPATGGHRPMAWPVQPGLPAARIAVATGQSAGADPRGLAAIAGFGQPPAHGSGFRLVRGSEGSPRRGVTGFHRPPARVLDWHRVGQGAAAISGTTRMRNDPFGGQQQGRARRPGLFGNIRCWVRWRLPAMPRSTVLQPRRGSQPGEQSVSDRQLADATQEKALGLRPTRRSWPGATAGSSAPQSREIQAIAQRLIAKVDVVETALAEEHGPETCTFRA